MHIYLHTSQSIVGSDSLIYSMWQIMCPGWGIHRECFDMLAPPPFFFFLREGGGVGDCRFSVPAADLAITLQMKLADFASWVLPLQRRVDLA